MNSRLVTKSIAVMPFVNESGNADVEYLSDGMTETLIKSPQLPNLNIKARSSVFRYKGKDTNPQTVGKELNVQAILNGRVASANAKLLAEYDNAGGMYAEAISICEAALRSDPGNQDGLQIVGYAYAKSGRRREAEEVIRKFEDIGRTEYSVIYRPAVIHALLGDKEKPSPDLRNLLRPTIGTSPE